MFPFVREYVEYSYSLDYFIHCHIPQMSSAYLMHMSYFAMYGMKNEQIQPRPVLI